MFAQPEPDFGLYLTEQEGYALRHVVGLNGEEELDYEELAEHLGMADGGFAMRFFEATLDKVFRAARGDHDVLRPMLEATLLAYPPQSVAKSPPAGEDEKF